MSAALDNVAHNADQEETLADAKKLFELAVDHCNDAHAEAHRCGRFYHNTNGKGQWDPEDLRILREERRPALTFNIVKPKIDTFLGMYADAERTPVVEASSGKTLGAEVLNAVAEEVLEQAGYSKLAARMLKSGAIHGENSIQVEVRPSPDGIDWIQIYLCRLPRFDVMWDPASIEPDRSDASHVFISQWMNKQQFQSAYPDFKDMWGEFKDRSATPSDGFSTTRAWDDRSGLDDWNKYYFERTDNKVRVIRYEYKELVTAYYQVDTSTGEKVEIPRSLKERVQLISRLDPTIALTEYQEERVRVMEFVGTTILDEYDSPGPFDGFSTVSFCYAMDEETGLAYGPVRNMLDPQSELNRSKSIEIEHFQQSSAPGVMAEVGQIPNESQFRREQTRAGGVAYVKADALVAGRVKERTPIPINPTITARTAAAIELLNEISAMPSAANISPSEQAQAGMTVAIRYHKSKQAVSDPFSTFEDSQVAIVERVVQAIQRSMPDDQILSYLGNSDRYAIQNGMIFQLGEPDEQGQPQVEDQIEINELRSLKWQLDLDYTSENSMLRMLEMDTLMNLVKLQVPVDPEVLVEKATTSRSMRERLIKYVDKSMKAAAAGQNQQTALMAQQNQIMAATDAAKIHESQRHNMSQEQLDFVKAKAQAKLDLLGLWQQADENEKDRLLQLATARSKANGTQ